MRNLTEARRRVVETASRLSVAELEMQAAVTRWLAGGSKGELDQAIARVEDAWKDLDAAQTGLERETQ